jgi:hypothetical protein
MRRSRDAYDATEDTATDARNYRSVRGLISAKQAEKDGMKQSRRSIKTAAHAPRRAPRRNTAPQPAGRSYRREIGAVVAIGIVAALGVVLWRGRDSLPQLKLPSPDAFQDSVKNSVRNSWQSAKSAMDRLPQIEAEHIGNISRGLEALRQMFTRA